MKRQIKITVTLKYESKNKRALVMPATLALIDWAQKYEPSIYEVETKATKAAPKNTAPNKRLYANNSGRSKC